MLMPKKPKSKKRRKKKPSRRLLFKRLESPLARLIIVLVIIIVGVVVSLILFNPKANGARVAADDFFNAFTNCNLSQAKKYYLPLQNPKRAKKYISDCVPGQYSVHFNRVLTAAQDNSQTGLLYDFNDNKGHKCQVDVYMINIGKQTEEWMVFGMVVTSFTEACLGLK